MTRASTLGAALIAAAAVGCGGPSPYSRAGGAVTALDVGRVEWNGAGAPLGRVRAVADAGDVVAVCTDQGATVLASRAVMGTDASLAGCTSAATIAGADGAPEWLVVVDGKGRLHHARATGAFEDVSARYGLEDEAILGVAAIGGGVVGFRCNGGLAFADGTAVTRYAIGPFTDLGGGGHLGVGVAPDGLHVVDGAGRTSTFFPLDGATHATFDPSGRLFATTSRAVYRADDRGALSLVYESDGDTVHGLALSHDTVWFGDASELGVIDGTRVAETKGAGIAPDAALAASSSGDVWVLAKGALSRFAKSAPQPAFATTWTQSLAPVFARACVSCHLPDGESGTDLSTSAAWLSEKGEIRDRVVTHRTMPPSGHPLSDADRAAIRAWTEEAPK